MITCPQCGTQNLPGMAYCEHCGSPLEQEVEQAPVEQGADAAAASAQAQELLDSLHADAEQVETAPPPDQAEADASPAPAPPVAAPEPDAPARTGVLTVVFPDGSRFDVTEDTTNIGRSDVAQNWHPELDLIPYGGGAPDLGVSRHQAVIQRNGSSYSVIDVGSTNGTFVNGKALEYNKPVELHDGDAVAFGAFNARISIG